MITCRLIFVALCIVACNASFAQKEKNVKGWMHVKAYLKSDSVVEGYLNNYFEIGGAFVTRYVHEPSADATQMKITKMEKIFEKSEKYDNKDIDSLITWFDSYPELRIKWEPQVANFSYGNSTPRPKDHPVMLKIAYQGKNVTGYVIYNFPDGYKCLYKTKNMNYAKAFLNFQMKFSEKRRKTLLEEFADYPEMTGFINQMTKQSVKKDHFAVLRKLDEVIEKGKK